MLFTAANRWSLCWRRRMQSTNSPEKKVLGKWICEEGTQVIRENVYALCSPYKARATVRFML